MYTLASVILLYCAIGVFALNNIVFDIWVLFGFGVLGYVMKKFGFPLAPMLIGFILGHRIGSFFLLGKIVTDEFLGDMNVPE